MTTVPASAPAARERGLGGATVLRGAMAFGRSSRRHTASAVVVEIVDAEERIRAFLPDLEAMMGSGLVTLEKVEVIRSGT